MPAGYDAHSIPDPALARAWCEGLARGLPLQDIRPRGDVPYLVRYFCAGWQPQTQQPGPALFLHHFLNSDPDDALHSHPWAWGCSLILVGGYRETRGLAGGKLAHRECRPGDVNILRPGDRHRVTLLAADCWTLFLAGHYAQPWGFYPLPL